MNKKLLNNPPILVILILLIAVITLYILQYQQYSEHIIGQNYLLEQRIDTLTYMVNNLESRLFESEKSSYVNKHRLPAQVIFCNDTLDTKDPFIREKIEREFYSLLSKQGQIQLYIKRSLRYLPMIETKLRAAGLPDDLKFLAIHESALLPEIRSRSNAVGLWQFMRSTGRLYRLKINGYVDERQDPQKSTEAAIWMIKDLYRKFGDWALAMAAYNGGVNRIQRNISQQKTDDFLALSLPEETERYYFKILATKLILANPSTFGYVINKADYFYTPQIQAVEFSIYANQMSLEEIAEMAGLELFYFKHLNPQFIRSFLPRGAYTLYIPETHYAGFADKAGEFAHLNFGITNGQISGETGD